MLGNLTLGFWAFYLSLKIENCRLPNRPAVRWLGPKFAFQKNTSDFTEAGQMYLRKQVKVELALFAWSILFFLTVGVVTGGK